jgi:drug/metabolite transporter (DMT)-like permease
MLVDWGDLVALSAAMGWASTTVMARHVGKSVPSVWYNAIRVIIASIAMLALLPWTLGAADLSNVSWRAHSLLLASVITGFTIGDTAFYEAMRRIGVARAATVSGCYPLVTGVLAVTFLSEPVTVWLLTGAAIIGFGVWLITSDRAAISPVRGAPAVALGRVLATGLALSAIAAIGWALSSVLVRPALEEIDPLLASTLRMPVAALILVLLATRLGRIDSRKLVLSGNSLLWLMVSGLLTVVSATLWLWSVELVGATRSAALSSVSPTFSAAIAVLVLGERLTLPLVLGMAISICGVVLVAVTR